jgi:histidinol-phosphatase (PHP family)
MLPPDSHVHTEWSWDAVNGSMERTCARARELGLRSLAFTDHADFTRWPVTPREAAQQPPGTAAEASQDGRRARPPLQVAGYLAGLQRCRDLYPDLRILSGLELGEAHWHVTQVARLLTAADFDRVLGSLHGLDQAEPQGIDFLLARRGPGEVIRAYLAEILRLVESPAPFGVLAHIDFPVRYWPRQLPFLAADYEEEYRAVLAALAGSGRALEINTKVPLAPEIVRWWRDAGGAAVTFGSDAHEPGRLARGLADAAALAESCGFRPGRHLHDFWRR